MAGIKDGLAGGLSLDKKSSEGLGLNTDQFISISDSENPALNYESVATEGFYTTPVWKWMVSDIEKLQKLIPTIYKIKEEDPEGNIRSNFGENRNPHNANIIPRGVI